MKTLLFLYLLAVAIPCAAQTFTVNAVSNCPGIGQATNFSLQPGTYHIEWLSGALSPYADDSGGGGLSWQSWVDVYIYATAQTTTIGSTSPGLHATFAAAEADGQGLHTLVVSAPSVVAFYLGEIGPFIDRCEDNRGSVTLRFTVPLRTEPSTWGKIKALYR